MKFGKSLLSLGIVGVLVGSTVGVGAASKVPIVEVKAPNYKVTGTHAVVNTTGKMYGEAVRGGVLILGKAYKHDTLLGNVRLGDATRYMLGKKIVVGTSVFFSGVGLKPGKQYLIKSGVRGSGKLGEVVTEDKRLVGKKFSYKKSWKGYEVTLDGKKLLMNKSDRVMAGDSIELRKDLVPVVKKAALKPPTKSPGIPKPSPIVKKPSVPKTPVTKKPLIKEPKKKYIGIPKPAPIVKK